jgi:HK97 family phage major capsid protein
LIENVRQTPGNTSPELSGETSPTGNTSPEGCPHLRGDKGFFTLDVNTITQQSELKAYLKEQETKIEAMQMELDGLTKAKAEAWTSHYSSRTSQPDLDKAYTSLGKLAKALGMGDREGALRWDHENKAKWDTGVSEKVLGTPLYSDAVSGSYLTTPEIADSVVWLAYQQSQLIQKVTHTPMTTRQKIFPVAVTLPTLTPNALQSSALAEVDPTFTIATLNAQTTGCFIPIHQSTMEDSAADIGAYIGKTIASYLGYWYDYTILQAVTSPWDGILQAASTNVQMGAGRVKFTDPTWDDLVAMMNALPTERLRRGASYVFPPTTVAALRTRKDANGQFILRESVSNPGVPQFLGFDVLSCDGAPGTSAAATKFGAFGNLAYFTIGDRIPMSIELYDKTQNAVSNEIVYFRARARYGGAVTYPAAFVTLKTAAA